MSALKIVCCITVNNRFAWKSPVRRVENPYVTYTITSFDELHNIMGVVFKPPRLLTIQFAHYFTAPVTLVSGNIGFMPCGYSQELSGEGASNDSGVIENVDFQGFRTVTLRLRHLMK